MVLAMILLKDIIIILFLAVVLIVVTARLRVPAVIGFLLTGIIIGPSALGLVETLSEIEILAEMGIIILMFTIGLEFSLTKIKEMKKSFFLFGGLQVVLTWGLFPAGLVVWTTLPSIGVRRFYCYAEQYGHCFKNPARTGSIEFAFGDKDDGHTFVPGCRPYPVPGGITAAVPIR